MAEKKPKDFWDVLNIVVTLSIAGMVGYWGYLNESRQQLRQEAYDQKMLDLEAERLSLSRIAQDFETLKAKLELELRKQEFRTGAINKDEDQLTHKLAVVESMIPHVARDESTRKVALIALARLGAQELAIEFASVYGDADSKEAGDSIQQSGQSEEQSQVPNPVTIESSYDPSNSKTGWMYLGRRENGKWSGNYTELDDSKELVDLAGEIVTVKDGVSGVNIRTDYPSVFGKLRPIVGTLKPGTQLKIGQRTHKTFNDFIWVDVEYSEPRS